MRLVVFGSIRIFRNECTRSTPLDPKLVYWCVSQCLGAFWIVSLLHEAWCKMGWTGAINVKVCATKSHRNFSQHIRSSPLFPKLMFWCVSQYLGAFGNVRYYTILGPKRVELVQLMHKFVPRSHVVIFRNERTWSTPLDHKLMFWCVA